MHHGISRFRRSAIAAVATLATTVGLLPLAAGGAGATASFDLTRFAGADRYDTAAKISAGSFTTATDVVVTTGENFPDALAGNYLAGTKSAPILLTRKDAVPSQTQTELNRLNPQRVWVLGGTDAVGAAGVPTTSGTVTRIGGATRYETAVQANSTGTVGTTSGTATAIIATGDKFADALSAGPGANAGNFPLYLTPGAPATSLHPATKQALTDRGIKHVILMGGTSAVSQAVESEINGMGITTERAAGADRTETARVFAEWLLAHLGFSNTAMNVARGDLFPDALSGGPHAGKEKNPILLTWTPQEASPGNSATLGALAYASAHKSTLTAGHIFGGTDAVSTAAETAIETAGGAGAGNATVTSRPELVSAAIVSTTSANQATATNPQGTVVQYVFDENVLSPDKTLFHAYNFNAPNTQLSGDAATVSSTNPKAINVLYSALTTTTVGQAGSNADLSVATVDFGAVLDTTGLKNPEGDAALGTGQQTQAALTAGRTLAPDVTSLSFGPASVTTQTAVTFNFDVAAYTQSAAGAGFSLVLPDTTEVTTCVGPANNATAAGGTTAGGNGTTAITVICPNASGGTTLWSASNVARGIVDTGAVGTLPAVAGFTTPAAACNATNTNNVKNYCNPLEASDTPDTGTVAPDLVSVTFTAGTTTTSDTATFTFDQAITTATTDPSFFSIYGNDGSVSETPASVSTPTVNPSQPPFAVVVTFPSGTIANIRATGGIVDPGAVSGQGGQQNAVDEAGATSVTQPSQTTQPAGSTTAPDLTSVALAQGGPFGNQYRATYTFDERVNNGTLTGANRFYLYLADGSRLLCADAAFVLASGAGTGDNQVICTSFTVVEGPATLGAATSAQIGAAVLGTVDNGAVTDSLANQNPEGGAATTGGTGTPTA